MTERKGILLVLTTAVISGVSIYFNALGVKFANPYVFTGIKNLIVGVAFLSLILLLKELPAIKKLTGRQWWQLILIGLIGGAIPFLLFFKGLSLTIAAQGSFIHKTMFLFVGFLAIVFLKEKLNKSLLLGFAALLAGNMLFLGIEPRGVNWGDGLVLLATVFWAVEIVIAKKVLRQLSPRLVAWGRMFFGALFIFVFLLITGQASVLFSYQAVQWKWVFITSAFLLGYVFTFYHGLKYTRASVATAVLALGAPITGLITIIAQGEVSWTLGQMVGVVLMMVGIGLVIGFRQLKKVFIYNKINTEHS